MNLQELLQELQKNTKMLEVIKSAEELLAELRASRASAPKVTKPRVNHEVFADKWNDGTYEQ